MTGLLAPHSLRPLQSLAASLLFKHRRLLLVLPRQYGGKTELGCRMGVDFISHFGRVSRAGLYLAKDHKSAKKASREKFARLCPKPFTVNTEVISLKRGKVENMLYLGSVDKDPDRQRGGTYGWCHWSEAAFSKIELGETIISVLQKVVLPTLELPNGYALIETTLNGKNGFYELWDNHKEYNFHRFLCGLGQMVEMGLVTSEEYERTKASYHPDVFRQEFECEFVTFQGRVFPEFDEARHVVHEMPWPEPWQRVSFAVDWGFSDATCVLFGYVKDGIIHVFDEHYAKEEMPIFTAQAIEARRRSFSVQVMSGVGDHDPAKNLELTQRGIAIGLADKVNVLGALMQIKEALYFDRILISSRCKNLIRELESATWDVKHADKGELDSGQDTIGHFDSIAALRYLMRTFTDSEADEPEETPYQASDTMSARAHEMTRLGGGDWEP